MNAKPQLGPAISEFRANLLRWLHNLLLILSCAVCTALPAHSSERVLKDPETGCSIKLDWDQITSIKWQGRCVDGWADGPGELEFFVNLKKEWRQRFGGTAGIKITRGQMEWNFDQTALKFSIEGCDENRFRRIIRVSPNRDLDVESGWVINRLLLLTMDYYKQNCPAKGYKGVEIFVDLPGYLPMLPGILATTSNIEGNSWGTYQNQPAQGLFNKIQSENRIEEQRIAEIAEAARKVELEKKKKKIEKDWAEKMVQALTSNEPTQSVADLIEFDRGRFISVFGSGHKLVVLYRNPSFLNGKIVVENTQLPTDIYKSLSEGGIDAFLKKSMRMGQAYNVVCMFSPDYVQNFIENGLHSVDAKLIQLEGRTAVFQCGS